jgi:hypothetical protein
MGYINTYDSAAEADADRAQQKELLTALNAWDRALRRDECGGWTIIGKQGSIHSWGDGKSWVLYIACRSAMHWTYTKKRLGGICAVTLDCEDEGTLRLQHLPRPDQAEVIRDILGIQKRREVSAAELERLKAFAFARKPRSEASLEQNIALGDRRLPDTHPGSNADFISPSALATRAHATDEMEPAK